MNLSIVKGNRVTIFLHGNCVSVWICEPVNSTLILSILLSCTHTNTHSKLVYERNYSFWIWAHLLWSASVPCGLDLLLLHTHTHAKYAPTPKQIHSRFNAHIHFIWLIRSLCHTVPLALYLVLSISTHFSVYAPMHNTQYKTQSIIILDVFVCIHTFRQLFRPVYHQRKLAF